MVLKMFLNAKTLTNTDFELSWVLGFPLVDFFMHMSPTHFSNLREFFELRCLEALNSSPVMATIFTDSMHFFYMFNDRLYVYNEENKKFFDISEVNYEIFLIASIRFYIDFWQQIPKHRLSLLFFNILVFFDNEKFKSALLKKIELSDFFIIENQNQFIFGALSFFDEMPFRILNETFDTFLFKKRMFDVLYFIFSKLPEKKTTINPAELANDLATNLQKSHEFLEISRVLLSFLIKNKNPEEKN